MDNLNFSSLPQHAESDSLSTSLIPLITVFPRSQCDTPKRRKHAPLEKVPSFASDVSSDAGESPLKLSSVLIGALRIDAHVFVCSVGLSWIDKLCSL